MTLPVGITTCTATIGAGYTFLGEEAVISGTVDADRSVVWAATGAPIFKTPSVVTPSSPGGQASFVVPHVDQDGFVDGAGNDVTGWYYTFKGRATFEGNRVEDITKRFQVFVGQTTVDLDLVPDGPVIPGVTTPTAAVTSVNGETGAVTVDGGLDDSDIAALVADPGSDTGGAVAASIAEAVEGLSSGGVVRIAASGDTSGVTDRTAINDAFNSIRLFGGGTVALDTAGTYWLDAPIEIVSNSTLDAGYFYANAELRLAAEANCQMITNYAYAHPVATDTGTMLGGSNSITYTNGSPLEAAQVGQRIKVHNAYSGGTHDLVSPIIAADSTANTITAIVSAGNQVTNVAVTLIEPDQNITILGGIWDRGTVGGTDTIDKFSIYLRHIDGLRTRGIVAATTGDTGMGQGGSYFFSGADLTNFDIGETTLGRKGSFRDYSTGGTGVVSDGLHFNGPLRRGTIRNTFGNSGDDMVAVMPADWPGYGDVAGNIIDVSIENVFGVGAWQRHVKVLGGPADQGFGNPASVQNVRVSGVYGTLGGVWIGDDDRQPGTEQGYMDNITVEGVSVDADQPVFINATHMGRLTLGGIRHRTSGSFPAVLVGNTLSDGAVIDELVIDGLDVSGFNGGAPAGLQVAGAADGKPAAIVNKVVRRNWRIGTGATAYNFLGTVGRIVGDGMDKTDTRRPGMVGKWYPSAGLPSSSDVFFDLVTDKLYVSLPRVAASPVTIDQLSLVVNILGSGSSVRLGIYTTSADDPYGLTLGTAYATLLVDAGTITTASTGLRDLALASPVTIPAGTPYCFGIVAQGGTPPRINLRNGLGYHVDTPWGAPYATGAPCQVATQTGVSGALGASFTPSAIDDMNTSTSDNGVWFRTA